MIFCCCCPRQSWFRPSIYLNCLIAISCVSRVLTFFFRPSLCFLLSGALPHKEGGVDGMETITTDAAQRGVMATGRRPTQLATPRRRCRAGTHSSMRVQKSCSGHGRTFNKTLIDKREHGCGRGLRCVRWRGTRSRWRRAKIQALENVETTCDIRSTSEPTSHVASSVFSRTFLKGANVSVFFFAKKDRVRNSLHL